MKFSIDKILSGATAMVVLAVTVLLFISIRQSQRVNDSAKSVSHTEQVLTHIQHLIVSVLDNETSARGYVITGKDLFLEPLRQSEKDITNELALLKTLTEDNQAQQALNDSLFVYSDKRIAFSNRMVALRRDKGPETASALVSTAEGKFYTDKIRRIGTMMQLEENRLLEKRKKNIELTISRLNTILYSVLAAGFILSIIIIQKIRSDSKKQKLNEQKFSALLDAAPDATVIVNEKGVIQMVNQQIENLFGYTRKEITGQPVEILVPLELRSRHIHHRDGFIKEARVRSMGAGIELKAVKKNGVSFPVEISLSPIKTKEGMLVSASVRDISERKKAEEKLRKSEKDFQLLVRSVKDYAIFLLDKNGRVASWNSGAENIKGYTAEEITGRPMDVFYTAEEIQQGKPQHNLQMALQHGHFETEGWRLRKDGSAFYANIVFTSLVDEEGNLYGYAKVTKDITERKKTEAALSKLNSELEQRVKDRTEEIFKNEKLYRNLFENMLHGFAYCKAIFDKGRLKDYIYLAVNSEYELLTGLKDITGKKVSEVMPGLLDSDPAYVEIISRVALSGKPEKFETYVEPLNKWFSISLYSPAKEYFVGLVDNITERKQAEQELQAAHDRLSFHIENAPLGFIEWDNQLHVKNWSKRAEEIFGWTDKEFISLQKDGYSQVYEEDLPWVSKISEQLITGKVERNSVEHRNYTKDGRVIWCEWFNSVLKDKDGKVITILSLVQDITERKKAEEDLRQSELRLNEAQAITHISNWEIDLVQNIHTWSDEFYRIYGINKGEVQPSVELFLSFMHPDDADFAQKKIQEAFNSFSNSTFDFRFIRKNGVIRYGCIEWRFEFDKKGKPLRLFGIVQDITERKEAEEELRKSIERFRYATKASSDIIWELNFETKQYLVHEGNEKLFGVNSIDWKLGVEGSYIIKEDRKKVLQSFMEARMDTTRTLWILEYRVWSENNSILHIINHAMFIRDEKGKAVRVVGAITDITQRKKLELELLEQQRNEQLKITATALEAQEKERNEIGIELHDNVNQILVATKLFLSMMKDDPVKNQTLLNSCMENLQNAINENRKIAHVLVAPDFETKILADQIFALSEDMLKIAGIDVHVDTIRLQEELLNDQQKLAVYRIAQEQCTNIVKYAKARLVNISLSTTDGFFKMIITDDGVGMETGKKTEGIGLKNMKGRLSIFNGSAGIKTRPGKGFILEIAIPFKTQ